MNKNKQSLYIKRENQFTHAYMNGKMVRTKCLEGDEYNFAFAVGLTTAALFPEEIDKLIEGIEWAKNHNVKNCPAYGKITF